MGYVPSRETIPKRPKAYVTPVGAAAGASNDWPMIFGLASLLLLGIVLFFILMSWAYGVSCNEQTVYHTVMLWLP